MSRQEPLHRVAILNRGEPAIRFLRALREYNLERGTSLRAIAFYTDADASAPFVRLADEAVRLGPALVSDGAGGMVSAYVHADSVIAKLHEAQCDSVWPGWGFISEDARFVERLEAEGITFIGPSSAAIDALGDKIASKRLAEDAGVPLAPWLEIALDASEADIVAAGKKVGFPLMVKASAGGGGRGIRKVDAPEDLTDAVRTVIDEVKKVFGQGGLFLEQCVNGARHIEVQIVVGADGRGRAMGVRDCSLQRRHQKVVEEAPSPVLPPLMQTTLCESSVRLAEASGYRGVGTAEFLYVPATGQAAFLEVNSRLQVEHTITEAITGCDLVKTQLDIARGVGWDPGLTKSHGWAIEARLNAEDPEAGFRPAPGLVRVFRPPSGPGIRVDSGVLEGSRIAPEFDSMIAKVIAWGPTRDVAISRLERALHEFDVLVEDGATNRAFLLELLARPEMRSGEAHTRWLDDATRDGLLDVRRGAFEAMLVAGVVTTRAEELADRNRFYGEVTHGIPQRVPAPDGELHELELRGVRADIQVYSLGREVYLAGTEGRMHLLRLESLGTHTSLLHLNGRRYRVLHADGKRGVHVDIEGALHHVERASGGVVSAPAPALVTRVAVEAGQEVAVGDLICMLEAMKMETPLYATEAGVVASVQARPNQQVTAGAPLVVIRPSGDEGASRPTFEAPAPPVAARQALEVDGGLSVGAIDMLDEASAAAAVADLTSTIKAVFLGYDVMEHHAEPLLAWLDDEASYAALKHPDRLMPLVSSLEVFADVETLFNRTLLPLPEEAAAVSAEVAFYSFCRRHHLGEDGTGPTFAPMLQRALRWYGVHALEPSDELRESLFRLAMAHRAGGLRHRMASALLRVSIALQSAGFDFTDTAITRELLDRVAKVASPAHPFVSDNARQARYALYDRARFRAGESALSERLDTMATGADAGIAEVLRTPHDVIPGAMTRLHDDATNPAGRALLAELVTRRLYRDRLEGASWASASKGERGDLTLADGSTITVSWGDGPNGAMEWLAASRPEGVDDGVTATWVGADGSVLHQHGVQAEGPLHPEDVRRLELDRYDGFELLQVHGRERVRALWMRSRDNARDERVIVVGEVVSTPRDLAKAEAADLWEFDRAYNEGLRLVRDLQSRRAVRSRLLQNRVLLTVQSPVEATARDIARLAGSFAAPAQGLGLERVVVRMPVLTADGSLDVTDFRLVRPGRHRLEVHAEVVDNQPVTGLSRYEERLLRSRRWGLIYPYEILRMLEGGTSEGVPPHADMARGRFVEYDLVDDKLVAVERPWGQNTCGVVLGLMSNETRKHPDGITRVWIGGDPTHSMGSLAEPECRRILAALDLAEERNLPVEWVSISAGARIAMDSGTENLDWTAAVLRRLVEFTQKGGVIHLIINGVNVGAQSYWNAEATMLMHTRGILIMTPAGSMVLTGKKALEYSGAVAAEDEKGIGGFERIMGPNGQAQYFASNLGEAYAILFEHYRFTYDADGAPARLETSDPVDRSILDFPYVSTTDDGFTTVGEVFNNETNPGRRRPFAIRAVMNSVIDRDGGHLERFRTMRDAETAVVWDAHVGGHPVCLLGIESRPLPRRGRVPLDGPDTWTGGTLFPMSSKKVARALNAASGNRPVVVLANLSGFDGSPESLRKWQLEFGAEIGRAVVNFDGPIVFVVIGRYHGGAYVVFSKALNPQLTSLAVEGSYASVIGGAPAAAVVFPRVVRGRVAEDARVVASKKALAEASSSDRPRLREAHDALVAEVTLEVQGEVAASFDGIHTVDRAVEVGSLDAVIAPDEIRPAIVARLDAASRDGVLRFDERKR